MQRRAVAVYVALFLLIGTASYALVATADSPEVSFDDPDYELEEGDEFTVDGQTYAVTSTDRVEEEDHGEVEVTYVAEIEWVEEQQRSEEWANNDTVEIDNTTWRVVTEEGTLTLREVHDREAILQNDPNADNETVESDGEEYVIVHDDEGDASTVPAEEYFPEPQEQQYNAGDTLNYDGTEVLVEEVTNESALLTWNAQVTETEQLASQSNVTLQEQDYMVFFQVENEEIQSVVLDSDHEAYQAQLEEIDTFDRTVTGLWRIAILSGLGAVLLSSLAFLPTRY